jgi:hypothetical protein
MSYIVAKIFRRFGEKRCYSSFRKRQEPAQQANNKQNAESILICLFASTFDVEDEAIRSSETSIKLDHTTRRQVITDA